MERRSTCAPTFAAWATGAGRLLPAWPPRRRSANDAGDSKESSAVVPTRYPCLLILYGVSTSFFKVSKMGQGDLSRASRTDFATCASPNSGNISRGDLLFRTSFPPKGDFQDHSRGNGMPFAVDRNGIVDTAVDLFLEKIRRTCIKRFLFRTRLLNMSYTWFPYVASSGKTSPTIPDRSSTRFRATVPRVIFQESRCLSFSLKIAAWIPSIRAFQEDLPDPSFRFMRGRSDRKDNIVITGALS